MTNWRIPLADLDLGSEEKAAVMEVLDRRWLTMGEVTQAFEREFADFVGVKHALAVGNCTEALHIACLVAGIGPGDEVIVPSLTFVATANAVAYTGALPVFAEVTSPSDLTISLDSIEAKITPRTRAIIPMHYGGYPCHMEEINALARKHNLAVIEDAAHAPGASLDGKRMGTWGDMGCFSFFSNKNMTTGEGGMVTTNNSDYVDKLGWLRSHGMTSLTWDRHNGHAWSYDVVFPGYNYRMDEMHAALGRVQLQKLARNNARRAALVAVYRQILPTVAPEIELPFPDHAGVSSYHLMPVLLPAGCDRVQVMENMKTHGVQTSIHYPPIHTFSHYQKWLGERIGPMPITEDVASRELTLPLYPGMSNSDVEAVIDALNDALHPNTAGKNN